MSHDSLRGRDAKIRDYQRLEHLGDAVIHFVITNYLYRKYPQQDEGFLSQQRSNLVSQHRQKVIAEQLELEKFVMKDPGVRSYNRYDKFLEALIGAIYLDAGGEDGAGYLKAKTVIYKLWELENPGNARCIVA